MVLIHHWTLFVSKAWSVSTIASIGNSGIQDEIFTGKMQDLFQGKRCKGCTSCVSTPFHSFCFLYNSPYAWEERSSHLPPPHTTPSRNSPQLPYPLPPIHNPPLPPSLRHPYSHIILLDFQEYSKQFRVGSLVRSRRSGRNRWKYKTVNHSRVILKLKCYKPMKFFEK